MAKIKTKVILTMTIAIVILFGIVSFDVYADSSVYDKRANIEVAVVASNIVKDVDKIKPMIDYAYVENGKIKLGISDNDSLARKPIIYLIDKEIRSYEIDINDYVDEDDEGDKEIKIYEIKIEIPSTISITVIDDSKNASTYKFTVKEDNVALTKNIPVSILEKLAENKQSTVDRFEGYEDIFELEYGKVIDAFSLYDWVIKEKYNSYSKNDIKFKFTGLSSDKEGNIKLDKYGAFKVTITHTKDKTFEETAYIVIKPDWRNPDDTRAISNLSPYIVYSEKIKVADYFKYTDELSNIKSKSKIDGTYLLVYNEDKGQTVGINDQISLDLNKVYKLKILNFQNNSVQDFYVMRQEKVQSKSKSISDVNGHWASKDIGSLISKGLSSGYPNGTFNPNGNITVKEFMTILSRQIALASLKGKPVMGNVTIPINEGSWGYIESKSIMDRLPSEDLIGFNYLNLDRPINREEVALLIDNSLELGTPYITTPTKPLKDVAISPYYSEITRLVDLGLISGYPDGTFRPQNNITRAEIAAIFARIK